MRLEPKQIEMAFEDGHKEAVTVSVPVRTKDRVYIVGCAGSKDLVPWDDKEAEFWGVNNLYGVPLEGAHYDRWFEIHNIWQSKVSGALIRRGEKIFRGQPVNEYLQGLSMLKCPVYMQKFWPQLVPNSVQYPIEEVVKYFANDKGFGLDVARYMTNTITYEIVLAIYEGFKEIFVYGVDMAVGTEYENQRPSCEFWLGVASGMGIKTFIPPEADLLKCRFMYGFEEEQENLFRKNMTKRRKDLAAKQSAIAQRMEQDRVAFHQHTGAISAMAEIEKIWSNCSDDRRFVERGTL